MESVHHEGSGQVAIPTLGHRADPSLCASAGASRRAGSFGLAAGLLAFAMLAAGPSGAQDWESRLTVYGFLPWSDLGIDTNAGASLSSSADPSDLIDALEFTVMFAGESHRDRISLLYDVMYTSLGQGGTLSGPVAATVKVDLKMLLASLAVGYDIQRTETGMAQVFGGVRYASFDTGVVATAGGPIGGVAGISRSEDYIEPLIGIRGRTSISDRASLGGYISVGGFGAGSEITWDAYVGVDYAISERSSANFGLRYLSIDYEASNADINMDMYGPVIGMTWRF